MNKLILLGIAATLGAARLAFFPANPPVDLQPTSPGTAQTGHLNISGTATVGLLKSQGTVFGQASSPTGISYGGFFTAASNQARGFYGYASATSGLTYGGFFQNASSSGRAVYGLATATSGFNYGGYFQTASSTGRGVLGVAASATGTTYGLYGKAVSPDGYGVYSDGNFRATGVIYGNASGLTNFPVPFMLTGNQDSSSQILLADNANTGGGAVAIRARISSSSPGGYSAAVRGENLGTGGLGIGVYGSQLGSGWGVYGEAPAGMGVFGNSSSGYGVYGQSTTGFGMYAGSNSNHGLRAYSSSALGIYATSSSNAGGLLVGAYIGAQGTSSGSDANRQAIRGENGGSPTGYAGLFNGNTWVFGTLSKNAGSFQIDHPLDPENKYLYHSFVESPDMKNIYDGTVVTDSQGTALVLLPKYFDALNKDFRYQLTVIGQFAQAIVAQEIENNQFVIRTDKPNVKVSWQVTGIRHDPYAEQNRIEVEVDKPENFRGKYIYPAGYGKGQESSIAMAMPHASPKADVRPTLVQPRK